MKATINGKRYDTERCEKLASYDHHTVNSNNYSGTSTLYLAGDGAYLHGVWANGQDGWLRSGLSACEDVSEFLNGCDIDDDEEARLVELGLIELV